MIYDKISEMLAPKKNENNEKRVRPKRKPRYIAAESGNSSPMQGVKKQTPLEKFFA